MNKETEELMFRALVLHDKRNKLYRAYMLGRKDLALEMSKTLGKITSKFVKGE